MMIIYIKYLINYINFRDVDNSVDKTEGYPGLI